MESNIYGFLAYIIFKEKKSYSERISGNSQGRKLQKAGAVA